MTNRPDPEGNQLLDVESLFGLDFVANATIEEVADHLLAIAVRKPPGWQCVVTPNVDHLVRYSRHPREARVSRQATVVLPDGMPIVWASRLIGRPLSRRLTGADLFSVLWPRLVRDQVRTAIVASDDEVLEGLRAEHSGARGFVAPFFDVTDTEALEDLVDRIDECCREGEPRFVMVLVSGQKHHSVADRLAQRWADPEVVRPVVMLLGASAQFHLGLADRSPRWMQRLGLEWLHRLVGDPRRMARRYLVDDMRFVPLVWDEWRRSRALAREGRSGGL